MHEKLLKGRDELSPETIAIVNKMVEGVTDPIEKAKLVSIKSFGRFCRGPK